MSKQARGFSGVASLSSSQDALIPPQVLAQTPTWNPLRQSAAEAKNSQWEKMREKVSMDSWIERQDSHMLPNINRLEQQFAACISSGHSQSTDQDLFPGRHIAPAKEKATASLSASSPQASHSPKRTHQPKHQPKSHGSDINWSMWAAAICLFLVGAGAFAVWMFSGQPDIRRMIDKYTADVVPQSTPSNNSPLDSSSQAADTSADATTATASAMADTETESNAATTAIDMFNNSIAPSLPAKVPANAAERSVQMSDFLFNQDPQAVLAAAAAKQAQEQILLSPISEVNSDSIMSISLPALPKLKRPADKVVNQDALSPEEYRWCALVQMGTTEVSQIPEACSSQEVIRYGQEILPYLPYFKVLGLYRAIVEQKRDPSTIGVSVDSLELEQWMNYKLTSQTNALNESDAHHCGQSWAVINGYFAMSQFGFDAAVLNQHIQHFNSLCGNKTVPLAEQQQWLERQDMLSFVQAMLLGSFDKLTIKWTNFTYLPPSQGNAKQMQAEITEAKTLLKQLGYKISSTKGKINNETREAIKAFELDMGLEAKGELTFSILLRLRLATQGYDSKQAWLSPIKQA